MKAGVLANEKLPEADKAWLVARIEALPAECFVVTINGYLQTHEVAGNVVCNVNVTVSGMK